MILPLPIKEVGIGASETVGRSWIRSRHSGRELERIDRNQALRVGKWQRAQQYAVDQAEDGGCSPDPERQRHDYG
jgi:hypothetical protein